MTPRKSNHAVLYLRSSKDRSDVSIDAQRRELLALASQRGLVVAGEFTDVVESGSDEHRPGLRCMVEEMRRRPRNWDTILLLDTSRLSRQPIISVLFERDAERAGVQVVYKSIPDDDPITGMLLKNIMRGIDQWHSLTSKRKGLAGMAENVRQGWRAGGKAPRGYRLVSISTGAVREGAEVTKTKLEPQRGRRARGRVSAAAGRRYRTWRAGAQVETGVASHIAERHGVERPHLRRSHDMERAQRVVESGCGAVGVGVASLLPALSIAGALLAAPCLRFHIPLIEPGVPN